VVSSCIQLFWSNRSATWFTASTHVQLLAARERWWILIRQIQTHWRFGYGCGAVIPYLEIDSEWWGILQWSTSAPKRTESSSSLLYSLLAATIVTDAKGERVVEKQAGDHSDQAFVWSV
jgi:hypothetical protein